MLKKYVGIYGTYAKLSSAIRMMKSHSDVKLVVISARLDDLGEVYTLVPKAKVGLLLRNSSNVSYMKAKSNSTEFDLVKNYFG